MGKGTAQEVVLGFDLGGTRIKMGLVERSGRVHAFRSVPTGSAEGREHLLATLRQACAAAETEAAGHGLRLIGVGIGTAGFVDAEGRVAYATENLPGWTGTELRRELEAASGLPAAALNDVHAMALGEAWLGAPASLGLQNFVCVALGTGIGGCLIQGGAVFGGRDGHAGGFGHQIVMQDGGIPCGCGLSGCWESYASVNALKRLIAERMPGGFPADAARSGGADAPEAVSDGARAEDVDSGSGSPLPIDARPTDTPGSLGGIADVSDAYDPRRLFAAARAGHPAALKIVDEYASRVAVGLVNLVHTLNAGDFVIGGAIAAQGEFLLSRIAEHTERRIMPVYRGAGIRLHAASLGEQAGVVGAACALLRRV
ncbi:ROK family protein [Saccharibacillus sp. O23]|uniref:ROK family protein n=1 Tax=Saccharibacillus sp. O23 TaxID=2009338 RepID=UPI0011799691|nr:ROK family protein [Saccharibacillus sp. O23]